MAARPVVDLAARLISGNAVALLNLAFQLVALAGDGGQIVIGQIAPLLLDLALDLLQFPSTRFQSIAGLRFGLARQSPNTHLKPGTAAIVPLTANRGPQTVGKVDRAKKREAGRMSALRISAPIARRVLGFQGERIRQFEG